jgi:hypothetical protein
LFGYGTSINNPIPPKDSVSIPDTRTEDERLQEASTILSKAGWTKNTESGIWELVDKAEKSLQHYPFLQLAMQQNLRQQRKNKGIGKTWAKINLQIFETGD